MLFGLIKFESDPNALGAPFTHNHTLVGLSLLAAVASAYAYLELAGRRRAHPGWLGALWISASGAMLGFGAWATHLIGLLAVESPLFHGVSAGSALISGACAVISGAIAFTLAGSRPNLLRFVLGGGLVAAGSIAMHYVGMAGLRIEADLSYRALLVAATSLGAFVCGVGAFWLSYWLEATWARAVAAAPIGFVIAFLHYVDMGAAVITPRPQFAAPGANGDQSTVVIVFLATLALAGIAAAAAVWDRANSGGAGPIMAGSSGEHVVVVPTPSPHAAEMARRRFTRG